MDKRAVAAIAVIALVAFWFLFLNKPGAVEATPDNIDAAVSKGTQFLRGQVASGNYYMTCEPAGCPVDKQGQVITSSYIVDAIGSELSPPEKNIVVSKLRSLELDGVWGDAPEAPRDSDNTAFAMRTLRALGEGADMNVLLEFYDKQSNSFRTFRPGLFMEPDEWGKFPPAELAFESSDKNNVGAHPEVAANVYKLIRGTSLDKYINYDIISRSQAQDGHWRFYFYPGDYYSTYANLDLLCTSGELPQAKQKGIAFITGSQNSDGSWGSPGNPYDTALALNALAACGSKGAQLDKGAAYLVGKQLADGSWEFTGAVWSYTFMGSNWEGTDSNRVITTALAVKALKKA